MSRRGQPKRVWHRGRRRRWSLFDWGRIVLMGGGLLLIVGYIVWLFVIQPMFAAPVHLYVWLPLV